ncbi:MAG: sporulation peptidase YabG [Clostridiaceae bacterium]|jgi:spore coat assembly protein|nr:sporulation peptidase YabG [Clostridiaceae bacterium]
MDSFRIGEYVTRKSYGGDIDFRISNIIVGRNGRRVYILKGLLYRIMADSDEIDLQRRDPVDVHKELQGRLSQDGIHHSSGTRGSSAKTAFRPKGRPGTILHIDSSPDFLEMCMNYYRDARIKAYGHVIPESEQPGSIRSLLRSTRADILVVTGHDGLKKGKYNIDSPDSYRHSRYFIRSVQEARKYEPSLDKLCIFAGACQSYFEGIMEAGANFASSPGRILIHALDPAKVGDRVALTDSRVFVTPEKIARLTQSGIKGIGGVKTRGHYIVYSRR